MGLRGEEELGWGAAMSLECVRIHFGVGMFPVNLRQGFKTPSYQASVQKTRGLRHRLSSKLSSKLRSALDDSGLSEQRFSNRARTIRRAG